MGSIRVTTEVLRRMPMGATMMFGLPDASAINSGKAIAYRLGHELHCRFRASSDFRNNILTLTKVPYDKGTDETDG